MASYSNFYKLTLLISSILFVQSVYAAPLEALNACSQLSEGNSCSIETRTKLLTGSCVTIESQLTCVAEKVVGTTLNEPNDVNSESAANIQTNNSTKTTTINIDSTFDATTNTLFLPIVLIDNTLYYQINLKLVSSAPVLMELIDAVPVDSTEQVSATFTSTSGILLVKSLFIDNKQYSLIFELNGSQLELSSFSEAVLSPIVDTGQSNCYNSNGSNVNCDNSGQDGAYNGNQPDYSNNGDGTISDNITGLIWQQTPDSNGDGIINSNDKLTQSKAEEYCANLVLANQNDWRLPNIKSMYSLIDFSGEDVSGYTENDTSGLSPFINTNYFDFAYGDISVGERIIDVQYATSTLYVSTTMINAETMFGVNMADGRIKGYGMSLNNNEKTFIVQCVRGNETYGNNSFVDNNNQTISDMATGLMWEKNDSQSTMDWDNAISYCETSTIADYSDWRLPNAKELQSLVDYTRSPDSTHSAAINTLFNATSFTNEAGDNDWGFYWSSTTHKSSNGSGDTAVYIAFGRALGYMNGQWMDVHGAGAQRSDPKSSTRQLDRSFITVTDAQGNDAITHGPQGDLVRINNYVRCIR